MNIWNPNAAAQQHAAGFGMPTRGYASVATAAVVSADRRIVRDPSIPETIRERKGVKATAGIGRSTGRVCLDAAGFAGISAWSPPT